MSLQVWLPLTKDLRNQGLCNIGTINSNAVYSATDGKLGGCYKFTNQTISMTPTTELKNSFNGAASIACWVKISTSHSAYAQCVTYGTVSTSWTAIFFGIDINGSGVPIGNVANGTNNTNCSFVTAIKDNQWHHLCLTYVAGTMKSYLDGILKTTTSTSYTPAWTNATIFTIGGNSSEVFKNGDAMNDIRLYNHCLSPMEVKDLSKGLVLHYPLNRGGWGQENLISNSQLNGSWTYPSSSYSDKYSPTTLIVPSGSVYTLSFDAKSTVNGDKVRTHYYNPNTTTTCTSSQGIVKTATDGNMDFTLTTSWKRYWVIYNQSETTAVKHIICPRLVSGNGTGTVSVRNVKFEEGSVATPWCPNSSDVLATTMGLNSTTEYDCSGFCNNGEYYAYDTNGSISYTSDTPKYNVSTHIASANPTQNAASGTRYLYGHCELTNPTQMSVAFWLKPITGGYGGTTSNGQGYFCTTNYEYGNISVGSDYQASAMNHRDGAVNMNDSASTTQCNVTFYPTIGEWHHYVYTYDGQVGRGYKDGVQTATAQFSAAKTLDSFIGVVIGFSKAGGVWRRNDACYSDFRIYATALSADDVKSLYQNSAYIDSSGNVYGAVHSEV